MDGKGERFPPRARENIKRATVRGESMGDSHLSHVEFRLYSFPETNLGGVLSMATAEGHIWQPHERMRPAMTTLGSHASKAQGRRSEKRVSNSNSKPEALKPKQFLSWNSADGPAPSRQHGESAGQRRRVKRSVLSEIMSPPVGQRLACSKERPGSLRTAEQEHHPVEQPLGSK